MDPPRPDEDDPVPKYNAPLLPDAEYPDPIWSIPLSPRDEEPVLKTNEPLTPDVPEFNVLNSKEPLLELDP